MLWLGESSDLFIKVNLIAFALQVKELLALDVSSFQREIPMAAEVEMTDPAG